MQRALTSLAGAPATLPDARLRTRVAQLVTTLATHAEATLAQALAGWAPLKAAYRFFANGRVTPRTQAPEG